MKLVKIILMSLVLLLNHILQRQKPLLPPRLLMTTIRMRTKPLSSL